MQRAADAGSVPGTGCAGRATRAVPFIFHHAHESAAVLMERTPVSVTSPLPVSVVVVNFNSGDLLRQCVQHLLDQRRRPAKILVLDNGSSDDSAEKIAGLPGITVRFLGANLGFASANNRALAECDTEFVALINPDAFAEPDWLERLVADADKYPDAAAFGSRQMRHNMSTVLDGTGDVYHVSGLVRRNAHGRVQRPEDTLAREIFSPCAGAALYRRLALERVGGFGEDFFCYVEDIDLGFRLRLAGYSCRYVPDAVVHHVGSASSGGRHSDFSLYYGHRNLVWAFFKDMPGPLLVLFLPLHLLLNVASVFLFAARGKGGVLLKAKRDAIRGIPTALRKRRAVMRMRQVSSLAVLRMLAWRL